jgi:hypothetical protein
MSTSRRLLTGAALFASALALQQCSSGQTPAPAATEGASSFQVVATNDQVMDAIIIPNAQAIWDSVVYTNGELVASPKTDDDWYNLQMNGYALAEAGNLLKIPPRAREDADWHQWSTDLTMKARDVIRAAEAKDIQALLTSGGDVYTVCTDCHRKYVTGDPNAPDPPIPGLGPGGPAGN